MKTYLSTIFSLLGSIPSIVYILFFLYSRPRLKIFFEKGATTDQCPVGSARPSVIMVENRRKISFLIEKVSIFADFENIEIDKSPQCISDIVFDADPFMNTKTGLIFNTPRELRPLAKTGYFLEYMPKTKGEHPIDIILTVRIVESELPFLLDMFPPRAFRIKQSLSISCLCQ